MKLVAIATYHKAQSDYQNSVHVMYVDINVLFILVDTQIFNVYVHPFLSEKTAIESTGGFFVFDVPSGFNPKTSLNNT